MSDMKIGNAPLPNFERSELDAALRPGPAAGPGSPVEDIARPPIEEAMQGLSDNFLKRENSASSLKDAPFKLQTERGLPASDWLLQQNKLVIKEGGAPGSTSTLQQGLDKGSDVPQPGPLDRPTGVPGPPTPEGFKGTTIQVPISGTFDSEGIRISNPIDLLKNLFQSKPSSPPTGNPTANPTGDPTADPTVDPTSPGSPPGDYPDTPPSSSGAGAAAALGGDSVDGGDDPIERLV